MDPPPPSTALIIKPSINHKECAVSYLLYVDFPYNGPWGDEMTPAMQELAQSINQEPGLIWKIWTENPEKNEAGGVYLFNDKTSAEAYLLMHSARLKQFGIPHVNAKLVATQTPLSRINHGPVGN